MPESREPRRSRSSRGRGRRDGGSRGRPSDSADAGERGARDPSPRDAILSSLQIATPLEEFREHYRKKQRSFEGTAGGRAVDIYKRAFELAEELIRKQRGGDERC